ncbi:MAG: TonB-dependent receptor [Acidobacteria bacterium]|nr:TonB-dependent receptor [Acidobacteriota bacterium]
MKLRWLVVIMMLFSAGLAPGGSLVYGQGNPNGTLTGATADASGALIPGVNVVLKYPVAVADREISTVTDERGEFRFQAVPAGTGYTIRAELTGFRTSVISDIEVRPGITQTFKIVLEVGAVTEQVDVIAASPLINLESSQVSEGLSLSLTQDLPLRRRDFTEVAARFQGIQHSSADDSGFFVQFHSRGAPTTSNGYRVDGMQIVTPYLGRVGSKMTMTAVQNMEFVTGGFNAEYGEQPSAVVNMVTKSGGNQFSVDYTTLYRPEALTSNIESGLSNQVNKKSQGYGFWQEISIGGAIIRDKLFYLNAFQHTDEDLGNLVAPKTRHSYFQSEFLKFTYQQNDTSRWDITGQFNPGNQYRTGFQNSQTSPESESQQRVTIRIGNIKNTRTINNRNVLELTALFHGLGQGSPADARLYHPKGSYTGELRSFDRITHMVPARADEQGSGNFSTGPSSGRSGWDEKRARLVAKLVSTLDRHTLKFGVEGGKTWGAVWGNDDLAGDNIIQRNITDRRPIGGVVTYTLSVRGRPRLDGYEYAAFAQDSWRIRRGILFEYGVRWDGQSLFSTSQVAPRLGLTVDPTGSGKSRVYANWGLYYEFIPGTTHVIGKSTLVTNTIRIDGLGPYVKPRPSPNADPRNTDPNGPFLSRQMYTGTEVITNSSRVTRADMDRSPVVNNWQVGMDFQIPWATKVGVTYAGNRQHRRFTTTQLGSVTFTNNDGRTNYKGLEINARRSFTGGLEISGNYTRSVTKGDTTGTLNTLQLPYRYTYLDWHEPHAGNIVVLYEVKGWKFTPSFEFNSGRPYSINSSNLLGLPTTITFVTKEGQPAGRNIYRMKDRWKIDFTVSKSIGGENWRVSPTFQMLNLTNRVNIQSVSSAFTSAGVPTNVSDSRQMQFGVTLSR